MLELALDLPAHQLHCRTTRSLYSADWSRPWALSTTGDVTLVDGKL